MNNNVEYHMGQAFLSSRHKLKNFPNIWPGWLVDLYVPGVIYQKTMNLYRKFQFIGNFRSILRMEIYIKIHVMAGRQFVFLSTGLENVIFFLKL